ncbi:hypothetical protein PR003_g23811 [Phytophthora rubi]|uniref:Uncharacterized protein n=1 Tax=Phytophthora rubi TaxID=129364 RepID=A0A6A4D1S9_9STRA|nr:hypothetical protein PR003_g23811 [Phytophthora rubi]
MALPNLSALAASQPHATRSVIASPLCILLVLRSSPCPPSCDLLHGRRLALKL